jgi:DNA invertase Pin-like site-specific DNA recombinase
MIRKTYGYCRVSSGKQLDGNGMSRQQKMLLKYIQNYKDTKNLGYQLSIDDLVVPLIG